MGTQTPRISNGKIAGSQEVYIDLAEDTAPAYFLKLKL